jgi:carboxyl-terminal processing protease
MERDLKALKTHRNAWFAGLLLGLTATPVLANTEALSADEPLGPESRHEKIGELVTQFVQKSHYLHVAVDDELSTDVMDRYIEALDRNRMYLL